MISFREEECLLVKGDKKRVLIGNYENEEKIRKEEKMGKKKLLFLGVFFFAWCCMCALADAIDLPVGDIRLTIVDWTFFDDPIPAGPNPPAASGNSWSVFRIDTIADADGNIVWTTGQNGEYLHGVLGNQTLHFVGVGGADPNPGVPDITPFSTTGYHVSVPGAGYVDNDWIDLGIPHNAYFVSAGLPADPLYPKTGSPYIFAFLSNSDDFIGNPGDGFETGPGAGSGAFGTFGGNIITGTPFLFGNLNATALLLDELGIPFTADGVDVFRASTVSATTVQTRFFLDVDPAIGVGSLFDTNTLLAGTDIRVDITNESRNPTANSGWNSQSSGQGFASTIPEPSTIILLGAGLLGIGILRNRIMK